MPSGARSAGLIALLAILLTVGLVIVVGSMPTGGVASVTPSQGSGGSAVPAAVSPSVALSAPPSTAASASGSSPTSPVSPAAPASAAAQPSRLPAAASPSAPASAAAPASGTGPAAAPTGAAGFDPRHTVVPIAFPLPASARYRYGEAWRVPRLGVVYPYNQIRGVINSGILLRAHDGADLLVPIGTNVLAPFAGVVVDPAKIWKPWDPARYGRVVVIRSTEPASRGYLAVLVHLSQRSVAIGQAVRRGQVVGRTGISGNAAETAPHLHVELRAPFPIEFHYAGVRRFLDVFDPLPSLLAADPRRRT